MEQQGAPWLQPENVFMPPKQAGQVVKAILKPPQAVTVRQTRLMDYLTGLNPHDETQQPDHVSSPSATFKAGERIKKDREEFYEQVWIAQGSLCATDLQPTHPEYVTRMIGSADNLLMTWPQFAIYQYFNVDRLTIDELLDIFHEQAEESIPSPRALYVSNYDLPSDFSGVTPETLDLITASTP